MRRRGGARAWRLWFFAGLIGGAGAAAVATGRFAEGGYGRLADVLPPVALVPVLLLGGVLIGYGARFAGGCTSGHGIAGCSSLSPGSFVTTAVSFGTAVSLT